MTTTDWRTLAPGRDLDAIVAERVEPRATLPAMTVHEARLHAWGPDPKQWTWYSVAGMDSPLGWWSAEIGADCPVGDHDPVEWDMADREPSTDFAAAWLVVEKLRERDWWVRIIAGRDGHWQPAVDCEVGALPVVGGAGSRLIARATAPEAPHAIVRAALAALTALDSETRGEG